MFTLHTFRPLAIAVSTTSITWSTPACAAAQAIPYAFRVEHRARAEELARDFRANPVDGLSALALRTILSGELGGGSTRFVAEVEDSRVYSAPARLLNSTQVNPLEVIAAHLVVRRTDLLVDGDRTVLRMGRLTLDRGSRRLVARNIFRNTVSAFTGADLVWTDGSRAWRAFVVMPVVGRPSTPEMLKTNALRPDRENTDALFFGTQLDFQLRGTAFELYVVDLLEQDGTFESADRHLFTQGARAFRAPAKARPDFEVEAMLQVGTSHVTAAASDTIQLSHRAFALHASAGYSFRARWTPHVSIEYDFASGDRDPTDRRNQRFDPLFGARAFELNLTGFYGAFARSNINSPGVRIEAAPHTRIDLTGAVRLYWLASARDAWTTAGVWDTTGNSGTFVGWQAEGHARAHIVPSEVTLEIGGTVLQRGTFARHAGRRSTNALHLFAQVTVVASTSSRRTH